MEATILTLDEVRTSVLENGDVATFSMGELRDAVNAGRLGVHVRDRIHKELEGRGLGHYPSALPDDQTKIVRVYRLGSRVAELIDAVQRPGPDQDQRLRDATSGNAEETVRRIKELVC